MVKKVIVLLFCMVLLSSSCVLAEGMIIGEHLRDRILESPHPYAGSSTGKAEVVWSDYYQFPDANYLVFQFSKFDLAPGDWLEIRHPYGEQIHVYTGLGLRNLGGNFISKAVMGSEAVIELYSTNPTNTHYGCRIDRITRGYSDKELFELRGESSRAICGNDDKIDAICFATSHPEAYEKSKAAARIIMDGTALCTAWLISCENHVITNSHCSWDGDFDSQAKLDRMEFQFMYQKPACGSGTATVEYSFQSGTFLENNHYVDYALIQAPLTEDPASVYGWMNVDDRPVPDIDEQMYIVGHPSGVPKQISLYSTHAQDQSGLCEVYSLNEPACISGSTVQEVGYYCDTEGGSSGSPVLSLVTNKAIALHHCANCPNRGVRIADVWAANQAGSNPLPPCSLYNDVGSVDLDKANYGCSSTITITVNDGSLLGAGDQDVTISSDTETTPEIVTLVETSGDSGIFTGTIDTTTSAPVTGDNMLSVTADDQITVLYIDEDDGQGGVNIPRNDYADIDCTAPVISNVTVDSVSAYEALISWTTNELCIGTVVYDLSTPPAQTTSGTELTTTHSVLLENLLDCSYYSFAILATDEAGNEVEDNNGGSYYNFTTLEISILLEADMDTDPGWTYNGQWAWGVPQGADGDPSSGNTGSYIVGYNLAGSYPNSLPETACITQSFDCSDASEVFLSFYKWLGVENSSYDHASIDVSNNGGSSWTNIWDHSEGSVSGGTWEYTEFDISGIAAGSSNVQIRWIMGSTDSSVVYCGWNIDDVLVSYTSTCTGATPTPGCNNDGDVNLDNEVTAGDAQLAFMIALGSMTPTYEEECAADCNGDTTVTAGDAQQIFMAALGSGNCNDPV